MNNLFVFNQTAHGHLHIAKDKPCEDASTSYIAQEGQYAIIVVADGHGSNSCFRSKIGSKIATKVALESLNKFAENYMIKDDSGLYRESTDFLEMLRSERLRKQLIKRLTDSIVSDWYEAVLDDIGINPISDEEIDGAEPDYADLYRRGLKLNHIYGTTMIAGLLMSDHLILLQQGDGRCDVFYDDATVDQPIPWDDRCYEVYTTSMCDDDVDQSIRSVILDLSQKSVVACFMGSDGVEDSFRTMEGTHNFYMQLSTQLIDDPDGFLDYLKAHLPQLSENGSGDDISVAGMVDLVHTKELYGIYKRRIEAYKLTESKMQVKSKIDSMTRKHGILQSKLQIAHDALKKISEEWIIATARLEELQKEVDRLQAQANEGVDVTVSDNEPSGDTSPIFEMLSMIKNQFPSAFTIISDTFKAHNVGTNQSISSARDRAMMALRSHKNRLDELSEELRIASQTYNALKAEFETYDSKYNGLKDELNELGLKIAELTAP